MLETIGATDWPEYRPSDDSAASHDEHKVGLFGWLFRIFGWLVLIGVILGAFAYLVESHIDALLVIIGFIVIVGLGLAITKRRSSKDFAQERNPYVSAHINQGTSPIARSESPEPTLRVPQYEMSTPSTVSKRGDDADVELSHVDTMSGTEFERWLAGLFLHAGWSVQWVGKDGGDQGGDLVVEGNGKRIVIQAKRYNSRVGNNAVREAFAAIPYYNADEAWVITNNFFTAQAMQLAESTLTSPIKVRLFDRDDLARWIRAEVGLGY